jgi:hypothetical protein
MVADQRQVTMLLGPRDVVDADVKQALKPAGVQLVGADALDDPPDAVPIDAHHALDRGLVGPGRQPRHQALEVTRKARPVAREGDPFDAHAVVRARHPTQPRTDLQAPHAQIEMAPLRQHRAHASWR